MNFIFSAPFRTYFNLSSLEIAGSHVSIVDVLAVATQTENLGRESDLAWEIPGEKLEVGELHYSELSEDFLPDSATPILKLNILDGCVLSQLKSDNNVNRLGQFDINTCHISYFDNTVGILSLDISFTEQTDTANLLASVDQWSTNLCASLIRLISPIEESIRRRIFDISTERNIKYFLSPEDFIVFLDISRAYESSKDPILYDRMLWVTRICLCASNEYKYKFFDNWTQQENTLSSSIEIGNAKVAIYVGNSVVVGHLSDMEKSDINVAFQISTYFYVLYDIFNRNLKEIFLHISTDRKEDSMKISRVNKIRDHIEYVENEFGDVFLGLQGRRKIVTEKLLQTWSYSKLVDAVQRKKSSVERIIENLLNEQQQKYERVVEAILSAIGGVALLDFILNIFSFTSDENIAKDDVPGMIDLVEHLSVDMLLNITVIVLVVFIIFGFRKR